MKGKKYSYIALGDSYTIGEGVDPKSNFPSQTALLLADTGIHIGLLKIIAKTGWTTDELEEAIIRAGTNNELQESYDLVTLLIGVNNQYRGRQLENYKVEFERLLQRSIQLAGGNKQRVVVLSIPDWGATPFASGHNREKIAMEIDQYNNANRNMALEYGVKYLDITPLTREGAQIPGFIAPDGLHPSGNEYLRWSQKLVDLLQASLR